MSSPHDREIQPASSNESADNGAGIGRSRLQRYTLSALSALALFFVALVVRLSPWTDVYQRGGVRPYGGDAFYHLRRIRHTIENFPAFLDFDPLMNFPHGAQPIWSPTFDWLMALVMRAVIGPSETETFERAAMWLPPILGASTVVAVYFLGRRFDSPRIGLVAAALLAILPAHFQYSQLGFVDHHAAVALISVAILWSAMALFEAGSKPVPGASHGAGWRAAGHGRAIGLGATVGIALLIWPGCLIHAVTVQLALLGKTLVAADRDAALRWGRSFVWVQLVTGAVVSPLSVGAEWVRWGGLSPVVLSNFQPLYFGSAAIVLGVSCLVWRRWDRCGDRRWRVAVALSIGTSLIGMLFAALPELRTGALDAWRWLAREEAFQVVVSESVPLFDSTSGFAADRPIQLFGFFLYLVVPAMLWCAWRDRGRGDREFLLWWTLVFFVATLSQRRFMNTWSIAYVLLVAHTLEAVGRSGPDAWRRTTSGQLGRATALAVLCLVVVGPLPFEYRAHVANAVRVIRGEDPEPGARARLLQPQMNVATWLRDHSPEPDAMGYSILAPWYAGHVIKYVAARAVVQDNFGDDVAPENFVLAEEYYASTDEDVALALLEKTRTRYVMIQRAGSGHGADYAPTSLRSRLMIGKGSEGQTRDLATGERIVVPALAHHRLVYASPGPRGVGPRAKQVSFTGLYEIVPGAWVVGEADPGSRVVLRLKLRIRDGDAYTYRSSTIADAQGRYALRVPYANDAKHVGVRPGAAYHAASGDETLPVIVSDAAVRDGRQVDGPNLRSDRRF